MGHFEFTRLPQGLCISSAAFQRLVDFVTRGIQGCHIYIDDAVLSSKNHEDHLATLEQVLSRFVKYGLKCSPGKVQLGRGSVDFLGFQITKEHGIRAGEMKTNAVKNFPPLRSVKMVRQFLGLTSFFRRTIQDFARIANPLVKLTRKDSPWKAGNLPKEAELAFQELKKKMCARPCLAPVDFNKRMRLWVDSSSTVGIGAILTQVDDDGIERPRCYASRTLKESEKKLSAFMVERLGILWACKHFRPYLAGKEFDLLSDHRPLMSLNNNKTKKHMLERIEIEIEEFKPFKVIYVKGESHPSDALSRNVAPMPKPLSDKAEVNEVSGESNEVVNNAKVPEFVSWEQLYNLQKSDPYVKAAACLLKYNLMPESPKLQAYLQKIKHPLLLIDGVVCVNYQGRTLALCPSGLRETVLSYCHDSPFAGHFSAEKTLEKVLTYWFWPGVANDSKSHAQGCHKCLESNHPINKKPTHLESLPEAEYFNHSVTTDLLGPLRTSPEGHNYVLLIMDCHSKLIELVPLAGKQAETVAKGILDNWISRFGIMRNMRSDSGSEYLSNVMKKMCENLNINQVVSSSGHARTNGSAERAFKALITYLRKYLDNNSNAWWDLISSARFCHNTTIHSSIKTTPFYAAFGHRPQMAYDLAIPTEKSDYEESETANQVRNLMNLNYQVRKNAKEAFTKYKRQFDKRAIEKSFEIGDIVYVTRPKTGDQQQKLQRPMMGPYVVIRKKDHNNYVLKKRGAKKETHLHADRMRAAPFRQQIYEFPELKEKPMKLRSLPRRSRTSRVATDNSMKSLSPMQIMDTDDAVIRPHSPSSRSSENGTSEGSFRSLPATPPEQADADPATPPEPSADESAGVPKDTRRVTFGKSPEKRAKDWPESREKQGTRGSPLTRTSSNPELKTKKRVETEKPSFADETARLQSRVTRQFAKLTGTKVKDVPLPKVAKEYEKRGKK